MRIYPSKEELDKYISYDPISGEFYRLKMDKRSKGKTGTITNHGYKKISINNKQWYAHRLAWIIYYGKDTKEFIDHIDRNKLNNRISNLRTANKSQNARNVMLRKDNKYGITGINWHIKARKWMASIALEGKLFYLGLYETLIDAVIARKTAEKNMGHKY